MYNETKTVGSHAACAVRMRRNKTGRNQSNAGPGSGNADADAAERRYPSRKQKVSKANTIRMQVRYYQ